MNRTLANFLMVLVVIVGLLHFYIESLIADMAYQYGGEAVSLALGLLLVLLIRFHYKPHLGFVGYTLVTAIFAIVTYTTRFS